MITKLIQGKLWVAWTWVLAVGLFPTLAMASGLPKAEVSFSDGTASAVYEIMDRTGDQVRLRPTDGRGREFLKKISDIRKLHFQFDSDRLKVQTLLWDADYAPLAEILWNDFKPIFRYMDLPSDGLDNLPVLLIALYWSGDYKKINEMDLQMSRVNDPAIRRMVDLYKLLAIIDQKKLMVAKDQLEKLIKEYPELDGTAPVIYIQAKIMAGQKDWENCSKTVAKLIVRYPKDFDWMPPALLLSARAYLEQGKLDVASQILDEVEMAYARKQWLQRVDDVKKLLAEKRAADKAKAAAKDDKVVAAEGDADEIH